jgi:hypothetical protein
MVIYYSIIFSLFSDIWLLKFSSDVRASNKQKDAVLEPSQAHECSHARQEQEVCKQSQPQTMNAIPNQPSQALAQQQQQRPRELKTVVWREQEAAATGGDHGGGIGSDQATAMTTGAAAAASISGGRRQVKHHQRRLWYFIKNRCRSDLTFCRSG